MTSPHDPRYTFRNDHVNRPNDCDKRETEHPTPTTQPETPTTVATPTTQTPTTEPQSPVEVSTPVAIERQDTDHAAPIPEAPAATETATAEVAVPTAPVAGHLPDTGAGLGLVPFGLAVVIGGTILARRFRTIGR